MPSRKFALEREGPKRLELTWKLGFREFRVLFDGKSVGEVESRAKLVKGSAVTLPDGTELSIRLNNNLFGANGLHLTRNGSPVPGSTGDPVQQINQAAHLLYLLAALNAGLGVLSVIMGSGVLTRIGFGIPSIIEGAIYAVCGYFTLGRSQIALGLGTALYVTDWIALLSQPGAAAASGGGGAIMRIIFIAVFVRGFLAIRRNRKLEAATAPALSLRPDSGVR